MTSTNSFGYEMQVSANNGDLPRLQAQLSQWESQNTDSSISLEERLGFTPSPPEIEEVHRALDLPSPPGKVVNSEPLSPPGHPINDILRLSGTIPSTPTEIGVSLEKIYGPPRVDEATILARSSLGFPPTPLEELDKAVKGFFDEGPAAASKKSEALQSAVLYRETVVDLDGVFPFMESLIVKKILRNSYKFATTLVLLFACSTEPQFMFEALRLQARSLGGLPTMAEILSSSSTDLPKRFSQAIIAAIDGKVGKVTVLGVSLVDMEIIERGEKKSLDMRYTSFAHYFVLAVGREGLRVFQAWGEHGYRLDQYLMRGGQTRGKILSLEIPKAQSFPGEVV